MRFYKHIFLIAALLVSPLVWAGGLVIQTDAKQQDFSAFLEDYERCMAREEFTPQRGEYETQEEYRRRVERLRVGCDAYHRYDNAEIQIAFKLSYDSDKLRFTFELPTAKEFNFDYSQIVRDDFPVFLKKLQRKGWYVDDPTPLVSVYKECVLRSIDVNQAYFNRIESFRPGSWRGCMTYYERGLEGGWVRDEDEFIIGDVTFYADSEIEKAREIKKDEANIRYVLRGSISVIEREFKVESVEIRNIKTGAVLLTLTP